MNRVVRHMIFVVVSVMGILLCSCNATKFVPENEKLLFKTHINVEGTNAVSAADLKRYLRQTQNTEILGFWKLQLDLYNTAPLDTVSKYDKWATGNAHKVGEPPVIYDDEQTGQSIAQIRKAMQNEGFFRATVDTSTVVKDRKVWLNYYVHAGEEYKIRNYHIDWRIVFFKFFNTFKQLRQSIRINPVVAIDHFKINPSGFTDASINRGTVSAIFLVNCPNYSRVFMHKIIGDFWRIIT